MFLEEHLRDLRRAPLHAARARRRTRARSAPTCAASCSRIPPPLVPSGPPRSPTSWSPSSCRSRWHSPATASWPGDSSSAPCSWMVLGFGFVTLFVGLLRDADGYRLPRLNVPIMLTLMRVALVPGICLFLEERRFTTALALYVLAALSDVFDGYLARRWGQTTRLGTVMDPLVDIVFTLVILWGLTASGLLVELGVLDRRRALHDPHRGRRGPVPVRRACEDPAHVVRSLHRRGDDLVHRAADAALRRQRARRARAHAAHRDRARRAARRDHGPDHPRGLVQPARHDRCRRARAARVIEDVRFRTR